MKTEGGQNWYQSNRKDKLHCRQVSFAMPQRTPSREYQVLVALVLFDAIPRVSKQHSVGLILLQCRSFNAVAAQHRCIPKCAVKNVGRSVGVSQNVRGEKLVWRIFSFQFICTFFIVRALLPLAEDIV
jgi:hypothetical protein